MTADLEKQIQQFIVAGLAEDVGAGDHTSLACIPADKKDRVHLLVKDRGVLAGVDVAAHMLRHVDPGVDLTIHLQDGASVREGDIAFEAVGNSRALLRVERLLLNTMQRMSGIATMSRQYAQEVGDFPVQILDTRKTTPLIRFLEKWAVRLGGCTNYRDGLYDRIMIKDNHIDASGGIGAAIEQVHRYLKENVLTLEITIEVRDLEELQEVLATGQINRIMLDNFSLEDTRTAVEQIGGRFEVEASGGITREGLRDIAQTGVDFISVGALTHSVRSLDLSLKVQPM